MRASVAVVWAPHHVENLPKPMNYQKKKKKKKKKKLLFLFSWLNFARVRPIPPCHDAHCWGNKPFWSVAGTKRRRACFCLGNELSRQKITQIEAPPLLLCPPYFKKAYGRPRAWRIITKCYFVHWFNDMVSWIFTPWKNSQLKQAKKSTLCK